MSKETDRQGLLLIGGGLIVLIVVGLALNAFATRNGQQAGAAMAAQTAAVEARPVAPAVPPVPPALPAWRVVADALSRGETVAPERCIDAVDSLDGDAYDGGQWAVAECAWNANRDAGAPAVFYVVIALADHAAEHHVENPAAPSRYGAMMFAALDYLGDHPSLLVGDVLASETADLDPADVAWARTTLFQLSHACPRCSRKAPYRSALRTLDEREREVPVQVSGVQELQFRHADIVGRNVLVPAVIAPTTYYNCKYRSTSTWRGFEMATPGEGYQRMWVYCRRGDELCDTMFAATMTGPQRANYLVRYPTSNRICEDTQAELVGFRP